MMNEIQYQELLAELAELVDTADGIELGVFLEKLEGEQKERFYQALRYVMEKMTVERAQKLMPYLTIGHFTMLEEIERLASFQIMFDLIKYGNNLRVNRLCELYDESQPLFVKHPRLYSEVYRSEYIPYDVLQHIHGGVYSFCSSYIVQTDFLRPEIVEHVINNCDGGMVYLKIDPYQIYDNPPLPRQEEATIRPANPRTIQQLELARNAMSSFQYILQEVPPDQIADYPEAFMEYERGYRKLEGFVKRYSHGRFTLTVEEVGQDSTEKGTMTNRIIHMDTHAHTGTPMSEVVMDHIDLGIQYFYGEKAEKRMKTDLSGGTVVKADKRFHLFRAEGISLHNIFELGRLFFEASTLVNEWIEDQLRGYSNN